MSTEIRNVKKKKHETQRVEIGFGVTLSEGVVSAIAGIGSAAVTASKTIRDRFHIVLQRSDDYEKLVLKQKEELKDIIPSKYSSGKEYEAAHDAAKLRQAKEYDEWVLENRKVRSGIITGTLDRYGRLSSHSKRSIAFNTIVATVIGAGATLSFFNGVATRDKIGDIKDRLDKLHGNDTLSR